MTCGTCRHDNELNAKFCSECGAALALCCSECGAEQLAGSKFCNQCGSSLTGTTAAPPPPTASLPADSAVRKQVTALFADLVGATSFGERVDPEAARAALSSYFEILRSAIEDHAGTVVKFTGDGVMAMFGVPEVAEDDALRAVAAGRELQQRFLAFAERVREQHGVELGLRVGINTGELVIGDDDADMVGDVLNTAARLEAVCSAGQVLVGEDTWRLTRSVVAYEVLGEVRVKGKGDALATFQVSSVDLQRPEESTPFVGRTDELTLLIEAFDDAVSSSAARLVTVIGAPGVGKTRLAAEMRAAADVRSFDLRFERRGSTTFTPIVELLRDLTGSANADDIVRLVGGHAESDRLAAVLSTFVGHGEARSTEESFWAVRRLLEHVAADGPIVVVVDDIQWAEPLFWDLLDHLVEWTAAPVMLVALARPELRELRPELTQIGRRVYASVSLEGLDAAATRELAARLLDTDELPTDLIDRLPASTEGNPLFVRELVQMLVDDGVLARTGDRWYLTIDVEAIEVPPTILSLLASRVERLPDDERQVVELASVIGTEFDRGLLGSIAGPDVSGRLGALIDRLRRKDLVEPSGTWAGDHPIYRFHHVLVRDAAYRRLLKGHRAELHERVGRYLDEHGEPGHELDVTVAHHYEQVHRYRAELGTVDDATAELGEQAMRRLRTAAEQALGREDLAAAGGYAQRALVLARDDGVRQELLLVGCEAFLSSGNVTTGGDLVEQLAAQNGDERLAAWTDCFQAQLWSLTDPDRLDEASALADGAAGRLLGLDDQAGVAKARLVRALTLARLGRVGDCEAELDLALGAARAAGDRRRTVAVLGAAPLAALWGPSQVARAGGRCLDVLRLLRITTSSPAVEATSIRCQGILEALRGRFDSARDKLETSRTTARDLGLRQGLYETELFAGFVELWAGDPGAAEPHLRLAADGLGALGIGADAGQANALLARALLLTGRVEEAEALAGLARESAGQNLQTAIASRAVLADIRAAQGRHDEARQYADEAIEIAERTDVILDHALALEAAARTSRRAGDTDAAARFERSARRLFHDKGVSLLSGDPAPSSPVRPPVAVDDEEFPLPLNAAWEVNEGLWSTWIVGDREAYLAMLAPDFQARIHELGPRLAFSGDRDATAEVLFESLADDRGQAIPNRLVAIRGDDLALIAMVFQDGNSTTTMYTVSQVRDGRAVRADTFAEDQLGDALDELDRRWIELGAPAGTVEGVMRVRRTSADGDYAGFRDLLADDFEVDHHGRSTLVGQRSADEFIESLRLLFGEGGTAISFFADVPAIADGIALTRYHLDVPDGSEWRVWYLWVWESGQLTRAEIYELDDFDTARARFDEFTGGSNVFEHEHPAVDSLARYDESELVNDETRLASEFDRVWLGDNIDVERFLEPDYEHSSRRSSTPEVRGGREVLEGIRDFWRNAGARAISNEVVAIRGDHLGLHRSTVRMETGDEISVLTIGHLGPSGRWLRHVYFDVVQLEEAQVELDRMYLSSLGYPDDNFLFGVCAPAYSTDMDVMAPVLHPDFEYVEHRPLTWTGGDGETLRAIRSSADHNVVIMNREIYRISEHGMVFRRIEVATDALGETEFIGLAAFRDGLVIRLDFYPYDDLDAAIARYDELVAAAQTATARSRELTDTARPAESPWRTPVRESMRNRAVDVLEQSLWDFVTADLAIGDHTQTLFADGFTFAGRRNSSIHSDDGAEHLLSSYRIWNEMGLNQDRSDLVAVRGDDLVLLRSGLSGDHGELEFLTIVETGADRLIHSWTTFDPDQLMETQIELDRQWADQLGLPTDHYIRLRPTLAYSVDPAEYLLFLHPDVDYVEHRRLSFESGGLDELASSTSTIDLVDHLVIPIIHRLSEHVVLYEQQLFDVEGNASTVLNLVVWLDGLVRTVEAFEIDDFAPALARYEELAAGSPPVEMDEVTTTPTGTFTSSSDTTAAPNAASEVFDRSARAFADGATEDHMQFLHDELTFEVRRTGALQYVGGQQEWLDTLRFWLGDGNLGRVANTLIATRGDQLFMGRTTFISGGGDEWTFLHVTRIADGKLRSSITYGDEQIEEAADELDRQWVELGGSAWVVETTRRGRDVMLDPDRDRALELFDPDLVSIDHRPLGVRDLDGWLGSMEALGPGISILASEVIVHGSSAVLARTMMTAPDGESTWEFLQILMRGGPGDDRIVHQEMFDLDQLDMARARFDELQVRKGQLDAAPTELPPLVNDAVRLAKRLNVEWLAGGDVDISDYLEPDFVFAGRRRSTPPIDGGPEILRSLLEYWSEAGVIDSTIRIIAIRDRHLSLSEQIVITEGGDELATIALGEIGPSGRWQRMTFFDPEQLHEALDLLEEWWLESGAPKAFARAGLALRHCFRLASPTMLRSVLSDHFRRIDHRPLGTGTCSADEMAATLEPLSEIGGVDAVISQYLECTERVSLSRTDFLASDGSMWNILSVSVIEAELLSHLEIFDANQLDHALELFHRLVGGADRESTS